MMQLSSYFSYTLIFLLLYRSPTTPNPKIWFRLFPFRSPLLRKSMFFFLFLRLLRCFSSPGYFLCYYLFITGWQSITIAGFPHSEISGSKLTYSSPKHIVVRHVLRHLLVPRHSPCALINLTTIHLIIIYLIYILIWWDFTLLYT